jgi:hypothetical protein
MRRRATVGSGRGLTPAAALRCWLGVLAGLGGCGESPIESCYSPLTTVTWYSEDDLDLGPTGSTRWWGVVTDRNNYTYPFDIECAGEGEYQRIGTPEREIYLTCYQGSSVGGGIYFEGRRLRRVQGFVGSLDETWASYEFSPEYESSNGCSSAGLHFRLPAVAGELDTRPP